MGDAIMPGNFWSTKSAHLLTVDILGVQGPMVWEVQLVGGGQLAWQRLASLITCNYYVWPIQRLWMAGSKRQGPLLGEGIINHTVACELAERIDGTYLRISVPRLLAALPSTEEGLSIELKQRAL